MAGFADAGEHRTDGVDVVLTNLWRPGIQLSGVGWPAPSTRTQHDQVIAASELTPVSFSLLQVSGRDCSSGLHWRSATPWFRFEK